MDEIALPGGNMDAVARVGDTVLRRAGPWTPTVHRLLGHLRERGVTTIPEALGLAPDGREVLSYLPGTVPLYPMPAWVWQEQVLVDAARLLRRLHDASRDFDGAGAVWQLPVHRPAEVVCHDDFSPHDLVFHEGRLVGVIDFDTSAPGPRVRDLAHLAVRLVPLTAGGGRGDATWRDLVERVDVLLRAYGSDLPVTDLLDAARDRLLDLAVFSEAKADELGEPGLRDHAAHCRAEADWLQQQRASDR